MNRLAHDVHSLPAAYAIHHRSFDGAMVLVGILPPEIAIAIPLHRAIRNHRNDCVSRKTLVRKEGRAHLPGSPSGWPCDAFGEWLTLPARCRQHFARGSGQERRYPVPSPADQRRPVREHGRLKPMSRKELTQRPPQLE